MSAAPAANVLDAPEWGAHLAMRNVTAIAEATDSRDAKSEVRAIARIISNVFIDGQPDTRRNATTTNDTP